MERVVELKAKADAANAERRAQSIIYDQYLARLKEQGLTPETLVEEIGQLDKQIIQLEAELSRDLDQVEAQLQ